MRDHQSLREKLSKVGGKCTILATEEVTIGHDAFIGCCNLTDLQAPEAIREKILEQSVSE